MSTTANNSYPVYYYRGSVDNNLYFANFCWKIVRTTSTGGVKLIYNGSPTYEDTDTEKTSPQCSNNNIPESVLEEAVEYNSINSLASVGYKYGKIYLQERISAASSYVYGNSVTYKDGTYTLNNPISYTYSSSTKQTLNNYHYTCHTSQTTCSEVYYIFSQYLNYSSYYAIILSGGATVETALNEMLYNSSNENKSTIAETIDNWYALNMLDYTEYLEDTIWCNDRSVYDLAGWNPNGGDLNSYLRFSANNRMFSDITLDCPNNNDAFTLKLSSGGTEGYGNNALDYPVGLITADEAVYAGLIYDALLSYLKIYETYWFATPAMYSNYYFIYEAYETGDLSYYNYGEHYVRPSISLKKGINFINGTGTQTDPYIIE